MIRPVPLAVPLLLLAGLTPAVGGDYFVSPDGSDEADGSSKQTAWRTVEHACDAVPAGEHRIRLAPGDYPLARTAVLKGGVSLVGTIKQWDKNRPDAARFSVLLPGPDWPRADEPGDNAPGQYLLRAAKHADGVTVRDVRLRGTAEPDPKPGARGGDGRAAVVTGGFHADQAGGLILENLDVRTFRLCGLRLLYCSDLRVSGCRLHNTGLEKAGSRWGGQIWTAWPKDALFEECRLTCDAMGAYGFKGGGSDGCRITRCVTSGHYFSVEHPHENEFGLEIDHCRLGGCISVPKGGPQGDPAKRGHARSVYIHHNLLSDSYTVEGPRNYLEIAYNHIDIERPNGRCYTQHGGDSPGPVSIHHNIVTNVDRSAVWMNRGYAAGIDFHNNTVFAADAGGRSGYLLDSYADDRLDDWDVKNNVFVAAWPRPRALLPDRNGVPAKIAATRNLLLNVTVPASAAGNFTAADLPGGAGFGVGAIGLSGAGDRPAVVLSAGGGGGVRGGPRRRRGPAVRRRRPGPGRRGVRPAGVGLRRPVGGLGRAGVIDARQASRTPYARAARTSRRSASNRANSGSDLNGSSPA